MTFNSLAFAAFLAIVLPLYVLVRRRVTLRNAFLLLASYVFYAAWDVRFLALIGASTLVDYLVARRLHAGATRRRTLLATSVVVNLGLLVAFKYFGFFADGLIALASAVGWSVSAPVLDVALPVGISFYTFQTLGYTIDVYRRQVSAERNLLTFALFVAFFPQLVAGPIERARRLLPQLREVRPVPRERIDRGFFLLVWGLFKKVVVADHLARVVDFVFALPEPAGIDVAVGAYAFAIQIYCDFSGYTDIARGVAKLLGFELTQNFDQPYLAAGPRDFWRRWHMSLGTWLRDHVYVPLGGGRGGRARAARNVLVVFLLGGLWHGAAWTFVAWGLGHGAWTALAHVLRWPAWVCSRWRLVLGVFATFHLVALGWILFRAESLPHAGTMIGGLFRSDASALDADGWRTFLACATLFALATAARWRVGRRDWVFALPWPARTAVYLVLWFGIVLFGVMDGAPFLYFRF